jgi:uncharacterized protein YjiS (DUF1127 family)
MRFFPLLMQREPGYIHITKRERTRSCGTKGATEMSNKLVDTYKAWRKYRETYNELMRLSSRDLADLGINRTQIPSIARQAATQL